MFCPKCGDELVEVNGELTCVRGKMGLNGRLTERFTECFVEKTREPAAKRWGRKWTRDWFCPGCGVRAVNEEDGAVRCPECGRHLGDFLYELTEIHPHR